jgi:hypothetical protein
MKSKLIGLIGISKPVRGIDLRGNVIIYRTLYYEIEGRVYTTRECVRQVPDRKKIAYNK